MWAIKKANDIESRTIYSVMYPRAIIRAMARKKKEVGRNTCGYITRVDQSRQLYADNEEDSFEVRTRN